MHYSYEDVETFIQEENVKFIRLAFFDVFGVQKNISILPQELKRAFSEGISFDASAIAGFGDTAKSDLFLKPDPSTLVVLPWRPMDGRVVRMYCDIVYPDGTLFEKDCRLILKQAVAEAAAAGIHVDFGAEVEFYLFQNDEHGQPTDIPFDRAGYMDVAPKDRGEDVRREICFTLIDMGIQPEASHHEEGPGQNEIDFRYSDALSAADQTSTFKWVVEMVAMGNGLHADFSPKPLSAEAGSGMHVNMSVTSDDGQDHQDAFMAGILAHIREITLFLNPHADSYLRLGEMKAPRYISWSRENRSQLIRIPAMKNGRKRIELRSPDPSANPYLCYALLIHAGLDGIRSGLKPASALDVNLFQAEASLTRKLDKLPQSHQEAWEMTERSDFVKRLLPESVIKAYRY